MQSKFIVIHTGTKKILKERLWLHCQHTTKQWNILWFKLSCSKCSNLDWNITSWNVWDRNNFTPSNKHSRKLCLVMWFVYPCKGVWWLFLSRTNYILAVTSSWVLLKSMVVERLFGNICCMLLKIHIYKKHEELKEQSYSC